MSSPLALGLCRLNEGLLPEDLLRIAQTAEMVGFESLWLGEHVVLPDPPTPDSTWDPRHPIFDPIIALSYVAACTHRIRLGTGIIILPQRQPLVLAKELATLDVLSGGRLLFGIGVGYLASEFAALGVPMAARGARTDDYFAAMRAIWEGSDDSYHGSFVQFTGVKARPLPHQRPYPPMVVGGYSPQAFRRAVRHAHGWYGFGLNLGETAQALAQLADIASSAVRPARLGKLEISVTPIEPFDEQLVQQYQELGVDRLILEPPSLTDVETIMQWVRSIGESVLGGAG
jgi:probable F420-dependent oxidoreductase